MALYNLDNDKAKFRICAAIQMSSLGLPVIYYGEEVARAGSEWPLNRTDMPWGERDIRPGKGAVRDEAMRAYYKALLHIRRDHPALRRGDYTLLSGPQEPLLAYVRHDAASGDSVMVLVNREDKALAADFLLPDAWNNKPVLDELSRTAVATAAGRIALSMAPRSVRILSVSSGKAEH